MDIMKLASKVEQLKSELSALDRKIQLTLLPKDQSGVNDNNVPKYKDGKTKIIKTVHLEYKQSIKRSSF